MNRYPHMGLLTYAKQFLQAAAVIVESGQIQVHAYCGHLFVRPRDRIGAQVHTHKKR